MCNFIIIFIMVGHNAGADADGHNRYIFLFTINLVFFSGVADYFTIQKIYKYKKNLVCLLLWNVVLSKIDTLFLNIESCLLTS